MATGFTRAEASDILKEEIESCCVALSTTTPTADGGNFNEPSMSTGYQRQNIGKLDTSIQGQISNDKTIFLFEATADIGSVTYLGLSDSIVDGDEVFLMVELTSSLTISAGYVPLIRRHCLVIGLDKDALEAYPD